MRDVAHTDIFLQQNQYVLILFLKFPSQPWAHTSALLCSCLALAQSDLESLIKLLGEELCKGGLWGGLSGLFPDCFRVDFSSLHLGASWATLQTCLCLATYLTPHDPQADFPPAPHLCPIIITNMLMLRTASCPVAAGTVGQALADRSWPSLLLSKSRHPDL